MKIELTVSEIEVVLTALVDLYIDCEKYHNKKDGISPKQKEIKKLTEKLEQIIGFDGPGRLSDNV
jgi:hypothetical protein